MLLKIIETQSRWTQNHWHSNYRGGRTLWLAASDEDFEQVWKWKTGDLALWQGFSGSLPFNETRNSLIVDRETGAWKDVVELEKHGFVCETNEG